MLLLLVIAAVGVFFGTKRGTFKAANIEALSSTEINDDICTSPKTLLGLGDCMNITTIICKDKTGDCD